jgi:hypothetical protein
MEVSDVKRLKTLKAENTRLKRLLAESLLENEVTREALQKEGIRTGPSDHGAVDASEGLVATPSARGGTSERLGDALSARTEPQHRAANVDRRTRAASPSLRHWNNLLEAASTW